MTETEKDYIKRIKEYACYSQELDLWNNTKINELEKEIRNRKLTELNRDYKVRQSLDKREYLD